MNITNYNPLISIIINCYNGEKYLFKTLETVKNQTYQNWEVIFWDVSTNNNSKTILENFNDKRFKYFNSGKKKNLYHSRNEAIEQAKGEIISFIDCDDWWRHDKLERQIKFFKDETVSMVYSNYYEYYEETKKIKRRSKKKIFSGYILNKIIHDYHIGILTTLIRKKVFEKLGGYNNSFHICGDYEYNVRLSESHKIIGVKESLAYYRIHNENISKNLDKEIIELENCYKIFKEKNYENLKKFENFLIYRKFVSALKKNNRITALKIFLRLNFNFLKLKAFILLCLGIFK
jgi:glycosyltransferase involved in cell wall biosynthesis